MKCGAMSARKQSRGGYARDRSPQWHRVGVCLRTPEGYVFLELKALLEPFGITRFYTDGWGAYERHIDPEKHEVGKEQTQNNEGSPQQAAGYQNPKPATLKTAPS